MKLRLGHTLSGLKTVFPRYLSRYIFLLLLEPGLVLSKGGGADGGSSSSNVGSSYSGGGSSSSTRWVFWYYYGPGYRQCGNLCIITFVIIGFVLLLIIGCGVWQCIQVRRRSKERTKRSNTQGSDLAILDVEKNQDIYPSSYISQPSSPVSPVSPTTPLPVYLPESIQYSVEKFPTTPPPVYPSSSEESTVQIQISSTGGGEISFDENKAWRFVLPEVKSGSATIEERTLTFGSANGNFSLQTNNPFFVPDKSNVRLSVGTKLLLHYYEVTILTDPSPGTIVIAVGVATKPYPSDRLPGWEQVSIGYHSDTGHKFFSSNNGEEYGPPFGKSGDTIGCGYYPHSGVIFFTKNGNFLGNAFKGGENQDWFPTVGTNGPCKLEINFGEHQEFRFKPARGFGPGAPY